MTAFSEGLSMFAAEVTDPRRLAAQRVAQHVRALLDGMIATPASTEELDALASSLAPLVAGLPKRPDSAKSGREVPHVEATDEPAVHGSLFQDFSPVIGLTNAIAPPLSLRVDGEKVVGTCTFGMAYEGPPSHVHGGWVAAVFDEVLGLAQALTGSPGMTGRLEVKYRRPIPLFVPIDWEGEVVSVVGRKISTVGRAFDRRDGALLAEAEGLFISIDFERRFGAASGHGPGTATAESGPQE